MLYVPSITGPFVGDLLPGDPAQTQLLLRSARQPRSVSRAARAAAIKPPYGRITAIDLNSGEHLGWCRTATARAIIRRSKRLNLPPLGNAGRDRAAVTKTLLFVGEGDPRSNGCATPPAAAARKFRAYDKATGAVVWETELPAGADRRADDLLSTANSTSSSPSAA